MSRYVMAARPPSRSASRPPGLPTTPDRTGLHDAAIRHLARYATTASGLLRVLARRIDRWSRATQPEPDAIATAREAAREVVAALVASGLIDDQAFAAMRAKSLTRAGRSRRAVAAHLAQRGIDSDMMRAALPEDAEAELAAAVLLVRKRRLGAFSPMPMDAEARHRAFGILARAGFTQDTARRALAATPDEAEGRIAKLRRD